MRRFYFIRGRRVDVEQVEGVFAVHVPQHQRAAEAVEARTFGPPLVSGLRGRLTRLPPGEQALAAFERANWLFVEPSAELARGVATRSLPGGADTAGAVFRKDNGELLVGTNLLTVKLRPELSVAVAEAKLEQAGLEILRQLRFAPNLYEAAVVAGGDVLEVANRLHEDDEVVYAEPVMIEHVPQRLTPTDPDYGDQWQWNNTGSGGGTAGADVSAEAAWDITLGEGARVAVIDNGFDVDHEDLAAGVVGRSGYFQMAGATANFVQGLTGYPDSVHGTFCAGMAAARHNNGDGGCGAAPGARLLLVASLVDQVGTQATLARAVAYCADPSQETATVDPSEGADVISCSLGPNVADWTMQSVLEDAIDFAVAEGRGGRGSAVFWATSNGNFPVNRDQVASHPGVIAVGRSTRRDREDNSAFGPELDFLAPGVDVYSTEPNDRYGTRSGTSYAAPCAAGVGSLVVSVYPDVQWDELRQILRDTCDQIGGVVYDAAGHNDDYGFGRINAEAAVTEAVRRHEVAVTLACAAELLL